MHGVISTPPLSIRHYLELTTDINHIILLLPSIKALLTHDPHHLLDLTTQPHAPPYHITQLPPYPDTCNIQTSSHYVITPGVYHIVRGYTYPPKVTMILYNKRYANNITLSLTLFLLCKNKNDVGIYIVFILLWIAIPGEINKVAEVILIIKLKENRT